AQKILLLMLIFFDIRRIILLGIDDIHLTVERRLEMGIAENIKKLRKKYGLTQEELAKIAGVSNKAVSTWEKGTKEPRMGATERIAAHCGIKKSNLFEDGGTDELDLQQIGAEDIVRLPIVGRVSCGNGTWAIEEVEGYEEAPRSWITGGEYF